jgi:hypothetical protein
MDGEASVGEAVAVAEAVEGVDGGEPIEAVEGVEVVEEPTKPTGKRLTVAELLEQYGDETVEVKEDGKVVKIKLRDLPQSAGLRRAALRRMDEAARLKREAEEERTQFHSSLKEGKELRSLIRKYGHDEVQLAYEIVKEQLELEKLSPQDQAKYWREREEEKFKAEQERAKDEEQEQRRSAMNKAKAAELRKQVVEGFQRNGLPENPEMIRRFARIMREATQHGQELTIDQGVEEVKLELADETKLIVGEMSGAQLAEWLGEDVMKKIRRYEVDRLKSKGATPPVTTSRRAEPPKPNGSQKRSMWDVIDGF